MRRSQLSIRAKFISLCLLSIMVVGCNPNPPFDADAWPAFMGYENLPNGVNSGTIFFYVTPAAWSSRITLPYDFWVQAYPLDGGSVPFVPNKTMQMIVDDMIDSGVYFSPALASQGINLTVDKEQDDRLMINALIGEAWTEHQDGSRGSSGRLWRSNGKNFNDWSVHDPEIIHLNQTLERLGRKPIVSGDFIYIEFAVLFPKDDGVYTLRFILSYRGMHTVK